MLFFDCVDCVICMFLCCDGVWFVRLMLCFFIVCFWRICMFVFMVCVVDGKCYMYEWYVVVICMFVYIFLFVDW